MCHSTYHTYTCLNSPLSFIATNKDIPNICLIVSRSNFHLLKIPPLKERIRVTLCLPFEGKGRRWYKIPIERVCERCLEEEEEEEEEEKDEDAEDGEKEEGNGEMMSAELTPLWL
ncbi:hypothetical protein DL98DRAFT_540512 [Cadophora sp. DSE1049]|nr:hypothetical protein DL98DRAFT_540512 [Cadophora sp. DSE1049]